MIAVVICAYTLERWDLLARAVASVRRQETPHEIVLVIDHNDELLRRATAQWPDATVVANRGAQGLSDARNTGVAATTADLIAFLDDDAEAQPGWLEQLVAPFDTPRVGLVGGRVLPEWSAGKPAWFPDEFGWVVGCSYTGQPTEPVAIRNPIGASMAVRRAVFAEVGLFHNGVGRVGKNTAGCEETELGIRARSAGWITMSAPASTIRHYVPPERHSFRYFARRCLSEGGAKAMVATLAGPSDALESERAYVSRALPRGVVAHLRGKRASRLRGTLAIVIGLGLTSAGYAWGRLRGPRLDSLEPAPRLESVLSADSVA